MVDFIGYVTTAAAISALYALVAIGFTLIFGVGNVLNLAHGAFITFGAFVAYLVSFPEHLGLSPWLGLVAGTVLAGVLGAIAYRGVIQYVRDRPVAALILTFVGGYFVLHALRIWVGAAEITVAKPIAGQTTVAGGAVEYHLILIFVSSWLVIAGILAFVKYTDTGRAVLAASMNEKGAALVGIDSDVVNLYTWVAAAALAGFAGVLLAGFQTPAGFETGAWDLGIEPLAVALAIVVLGGLGSIRGSIVGAYLVGFIVTATNQFVDPRLTGLVALVMLVVVLLVRPSGLFGREVPA